MSFPQPIEKVRQNFPQLSRLIHGKPLIYFDNAATTLKPLSVIESINRYYSQGTANIHRGVHTISEEASSLYEATRLLLRDFIHARSEREIIFTRGTTESINLLANCLSRSSLLNRGDEVIITAMEHHANIVPWQILRDEMGIVLKVLPIDESGVLKLDLLPSLITEKSKVFSFVHTSNSLGTINSVEKALKIAKEHGLITILDAAQAVAHTPLDVQKLGVDFMAFSGHKMLGPTGVGVLYGREAMLEKLPPYQGGGDMILSVSFEKTVYNQLPQKFEAGTPAIAEVIALAEAIKTLQDYGLENIKAREKELAHYAQKKLLALEGLKLIGESPERTSIFSFTYKGIHPHDIGTLADEAGIALRTGHHCTQPVMKFFSLPATTRASLSFYNTHSEVDTLVDTLKRIGEFFA